MAAGDGAPNGAATLSDVAREAGVSLATASRVLNGSVRKVAPGYSERVQAAADRLGYVPNLSAQATARGTSAVIALLVADIADPYFGEIAAGVAAGAEGTGTVLTIGITGRDPRREVGVVRAMRGQRPRGVILAASRMSRAIRAELRKELDAVIASGGRVVVMGHGAGDIRSIRLDNRGGAAALGAALAGAGYRDAVILATHEGVVTSDDRVAGFAEGFTGAAGHEPRIYRGEFNREAGAELMRRALADGVAAGTVVFGISDVMAIGAVTALREAGRAVGADVAVAGFDDVPAGRDLTPPLTTVHVPLQDIGHLAFRAATEPEWSEGEALRLDVVLRDSTPPRV